MSELKES